LQAVTLCAGVQQLHLSLSRQNRERI